MVLIVNVLVIDHIHWPCHTDVKSFNVSGDNGLLQGYGVSDHEPEEELGSLANLRLDVDVSVEHLADLLANVQSQSDSLPVHAVLLGQLSEQLEELTLVLLADALARVLHEYFHELAQDALVPLREDPPAELHPAASLRELHCVRQ
jgi:hypothetical protein